VTRDRWLLPRRQTEYPLRDLVSEEKLHARRESTFLALGSLVLATCAASIFLGADRAIDLAALFDLDASALPAPLVIPLGLVPVAFAVLPILLACELYGRRRASALVWAGSFAALAALGLARVRDVFDGGFAFEAGLPIASYWLLALPLAVITYDPLRARSPGRHLWLRLSVTAFIAGAIGWAALAATRYALGSTDLSDAPACAGYLVACAIALVVPYIVCARAFALYLRVARFAAADDYHDGPRKRRATVVEEDEEAASSFFAEGDQIDR
jgi:uncharacterized PurR-regulated membrane protein YhhQ (DUF165 family)